MNPKPFSKPSLLLRPENGEGVIAKLHLTPETRRALNWGATKSGMSFHGFILTGGVELLRRVVTEAGSRGESVPENVKELLAKKNE